jgi:hypothetical protein
MKSSSPIDSIHTLDFEKRLSINPLAIARNGIDGR